MGKNSGVLLKIKVLRMFSDEALLSCKGPGRRESSLINYDKNFLTEIFTDSDFEHN